MNSSTFALSCFMDSKPRYYAETMSFIWSIKENISVKLSDVFIHYTRETDPTIIEILSKYGVRLTEVDKVSTVSPPLNKLSQLDNPLFRNYDYVVLNDCDKYFLNDPSPWIRGNSIAACEFVARPGERIFQNIFEHFGLGHLRVKLASPDKQCLEIPEYRTYVNNHNGGIIIVPKHQMDDLATKWKAWSN